MKGFTFKSTKGNNYLYDDHTGFIYPLNNDKGISYYEEKFCNVINESSNQIISEPTEENIENYLYEQANGFRQLILEAASGCNLRCKYCIYSEHYPGYKGYSDKFMSLETAIKAVDYYMLNFRVVQELNPSRQANIGFYGGEPLMNYKVIKELVEYVNSKYGKQTYNITTNGLLFNESVQDFLVENNFSIIISVDGNKENHDRNRVKLDGSGSFDDIMYNINNFRNRYPEYSKFGLSMCYDYKTNLFEVEKFIDEKQLFVTKLSMIDSNNTTYYKNFTYEDFENFKKMKSHYEERFSKVCENNTLEKNTFLYTYVGVDYAGFAFHPVYNEIRPTIVPYSGCCVPGEKLYVTIDGMIHMCEKINTNYPIGEIENGIKLDVISAIIKRYNGIFKNRCEKCNVSKFCSVCYAQCCNETEFKKNFSECVNLEKIIREKMIQYIDLLEKNPRVFEEITVEYYNDIFKKAGECIEF